MWTLSSLVRASVVAILAAVAALGGPAGPSRAAGPERDRRLCRRLLLVHGGRLRQGEGCALHDIRIYRRTQGQADLRAGVGWGHGPRRGGPSGLRPDPRDLRGIGRALLAHHRPVQRARPVLRHGESYRPVIFVADERQRTAATARAIACRSSSRIESWWRLRPPRTFYRAEDYHQDYYKKNPVRYNFYRWNCGRDSRLARVWGEH